MLISNKDALKRLSSPMNLMNRGSAGNGSRSKAMSLFVPASRSEEEVKEFHKPQEQEEVVSISFNPFGKDVLIKNEKVEEKKEEPKTSVENLLNNSEAQIKLGLAHDSALDILTNSMRMLSDKLGDVKAEKLPAVITAASKVVEGIRKERNEAAKNGKDREVHYHFYTPQQKTVSDYKVIDVTQ